MGGGEEVERYTFDVTQKHAQDVVHISFMNSAAADVSRDERQFNFGVCRPLTSKCSKKEKNPLI